MKFVAKNIMRDYERDRLQADKLLALKKEEVYKKIPRVLDIDNELEAASISIMREIIGFDSSDSSDFGSKEKKVERLKFKNEALLSEKKSLMKENGFGESYFDDAYKCKLCKDTGFIESKKCICFEQKLISQYYDLSNLKDVLKRENFDMFDMRYYSDETDPKYGESSLANIKDVYRKSMMFAKNFKHHYDNILFYGHTGVGKTFLCNCIAKDVLDKGNTVLYLSSPQLFSLIEDYRFNRENIEEPDETLKTIHYVDLLIIDDLGVELSSIVTSSSLYDIVNSRILNKKHTIISTNLGMGDLLEKYSDRFTSRIIGYYQVMKLFSNDIRVSKKYSG